ncbi:MAG: hypothetical protein IPP21_19940 [Betaproteobacteria bacterium]|nr:hypothetical protein [Betaproteobacteria bacterium]
MDVEDGKKDTAGVLPMTSLAGRAGRLILAALRHAESVLQVTGLLTWRATGEDSAGTVVPGIGTMLAFG